MYLFLENRRGEEFTSSKSSYDVGQHERVRFLEREVGGVVNCAIVSRSDMGNDHTYQEQMRDDCSGAWSPMSSGVSQDDRDIHSAVTSNATRSTLQMTSVKLFGLCFLSVCYFSAPHSKYLVLPYHLLIRSAGVFKLREYISSKISCFIVRSRIGFAVLRRYHWTLPILNADVGASVLFKDLTQQQSVVSTLKIGVHDSVNDRIKTVHCPGKERCPDVWHRVSQFWVYRVDDEEWCCAQHEPEEDQGHHPR